MRSLAFATTSLSTPWLSIIQALPWKRSARADSAPPISRPAIGCVGRKRVVGIAEVDTSTLTLDFTDPISINADSGLVAYSLSRSDFTAPRGVAKMTRSTAALDGLFTRSPASACARGSLSTIVTPTPLRARPRPIEVPMRPEPRIRT